MIRSFGLGPQAQKGIFNIWNRTSIRKTAVNVWRSAKTMRQRNGWFFALFGSMVDHIVPNNESYIDCVHQYLFVYFITLFSPCFQPLCFSLSVLFSGFLLFFLLLSSPLLSCRALPCPHQRTHTNAHTFLGSGRRYVEWKVLEIPGWAVSWTSLDLERRMRPQVSGPESW